MTIQYFRSIIWGFLLSCLVFGWAAWMQFDAPTPTSQWIYDLYALKTKIAAQIDSPKLVVTAGSNAMIGISCSQIQTATKIPCVNGAINVGLGLDYILYQARSFVREGDTLLLPLEYELYETDPRPSSVAIDYIFAHDPAYWQQADIVLKTRLLLGLGLKRTLIGVVNKLQYDSEQERTVKRLKSINAAGDWVRNRSIDLTPEHQRRLRLFAPHKSSSLGLTNYSQQKITEFVQWCRQHRIKVVIAWPNTVEYPEYQQAEYQDFFASIKTFFQQLDAPIIGEPEEYMYDRSLFFDSTYHLNNTGVAIRTQQLIDSLTAAQINVAT
ncbi:MAG: hypothetical protein AAFV28_10080 [Cyanobacteria bacterium J06635_13]